MSQTDPPIQNISDTARWAAVYRARESDRPDAIFRDRLARRLAGERGEQIAAAMPFLEQHSWTWITRTYLFDQFISEQVEEGVDMVVNLAAGLDARPYRMALPPALRWVEVDLPELLDYKDKVLEGEKPACALERIRLDLADVGARRELFDRLGTSARKVLVVSEGLLVYFSPEEVGALAQDLAHPPSFQRWALDVASPGLRAMLQKNLGAPLGQGGASLKFGPEEGPGFFTRFGWTPIDVRSMLKTAARLKRLSTWMRLLALLPESKGRQGNRPWAGICLLAKQ
ncbi:MAG: class I SAM-dependent methyltransferase [Isosphaeraceae bacterium]